jgi:hypothetical protein
MTTVTIPLAIQVGEGVRVEMGVGVPVVLEGVGNGQPPRLMVDEDGFARVVAEALLLVAATMLDARHDPLSDVVGVALDAFDVI